MTAQSSEFTPADIPTGIVEVNGKPYMHDAKGSLVPVELIKPANQLEDQTVRSIIGYGRALSDQITRFKAHTFTDLGGFDAILAQEYGQTKGGPKGNRTYMSFDGLMKVEVRIQDQIDFGSELQVAKGLVDECLNEWSADARAEIRAIVTSAFNTDKEGKINRTEIFKLLRLDIEDARWLEAMRAVKDAMRIVGSKTHVRMYIRETFDAAWSIVTIDLAKA